MLQQFRFSILLLTIVTNNFASHNPVPYAIGNHEEQEVRAREVSDDLSPLSSGRLRSGACGKIRERLIIEKKGCTIW